MSHKPSGVDNTSRRKWDKSQYEDKAKERERKDAAAEESNLDAKKRKRLERDPLHQGLIVERANLRARDFQVDLAANLNRSQMVSVTMPLNQQGGYYCSVCDCVLKDSLSYLDHINGKWHQRALGMSMRVEQSTAQQVRNALDAAKKQKNISRKKEQEQDFIPDGFSKEALEEDETTADDKRQEEDEAEEASEEDGGGDMGSLMGFSGFGSSKK